MLDSMIAYQKKMENTAQGWYALEDALHARME